MKDIDGNIIKEGDTLERAVEGRGVSIGHRYTVVSYDFDNDTDGDDLVADGGFIKELLYEERAKEFRIVNE